MSAAGTEFVAGAGLVAGPGPVAGFGVETWANAVPHKRAAEKRKAKRIICMSSSNLETCVPSRIIALLAPLPECQEAKLEVRGKLLNGFYRRLSGCRLERRIFKQSNSAQFCRVDLVRFVGELLANERGPR
jgi:hypothetical protein